MDIYLISSKFTPEDDLRVNDILCTSTRHFRAIAIAVSVCATTPVTAFRSVHACIVEFLFRHMILISDVGGRCAPREHAAIPSGRTRLVYKNFLPLTRRDLLASDRMAANSALAKSHGTCRDASRRIASHRIASRCTASSLRDLALARVNAASDVIKKITWTDPSGI